MQLSYEGDYDKQALYYLGKLYTDQLKEAGGYRELSKAIGSRVMLWVVVSVSFLAFGQLTIYY